MLRLLASYVLVMAFVAAATSAVVVYSAVESGRFLTTERNVSVVKKEKEFAEAGHSVARREGPPVWIAPTPKYQYDPKLMTVQPREERLKEVELRRKQEGAEQFAKQRAATKARQMMTQKRERQVREHASAYAYQPEARLSFGLLSIFR